MKTTVYYKIAIILAAAIVPPLASARPMASGGTLVEEVREFTREADATQRQNAQWLSEPNLQPAAQGARDLDRLMRSGDYDEAERALRELNAKGLAAPYWRDVERKMGELARDSFNTVVKGQQILRRDWADTSADDLPTYRQMSDFARQFAREGSTTSDYALRGAERIRDTTAAAYAAILETYPEMALDLPLDNLDLSEQQVRERTQLALQWALRFEFEARQAEIRAVWLEALESRVLPARRSGVPSAPGDPSTWNTSIFD
ncbi:MAG: hypothetical protein JJU00_20150 [Opitutales bacterium]|nr:hypothetical protein [Opitutales bacterium]